MMAYFPNGTSGEIYHEQYCSRCIHRDGPDGNTGCGVMLAHLLHNYAECNNPDSILHLLIPRDGIENKQCRMFIDDKQLKLFDAAESDEEECR